MNFKLLPYWYTNNYFIIERANLEKSLDRKKHLKNNPFTTIKNRNVRNPVLGQRIKGNIRKPSATIKRGIESRKKSILSQFNAIENNSNNKFIDNRYNVQINEKLSQLNKKEKSKYKIANEKKRIEKMMNRIRTQRLKKNKKSFNIDEDTIQLTHLGKPLKLT